MRLASIQSNVVFGDPEANTRNAVAHLERLKQEGVDLAVFPEAYLTGYCVDSRQGAERIAISRDHSSIQAIRRAVDDLGIATVFGFAESAGGRLYNTALLLEPGVEARSYRKTHLPELGYDRFVEGGDAMPVFQTRHCKLAVLICFDLRIPETVRSVMLAGAEVVVLPTNWPKGAEISAEQMATVRAVENAVFLATCDRVGTENGFSFIGLSKIISPRGVILAAAGTDEEVIQARFDPAEARDKRRTVVPGKYETTVLECRRPELYGEITAGAREVAKV